MCRLDVLAWGFRRQSRQRKDHDNRDRQGSRFGYPILARLHPTPGRGLATGFGLLAWDAAAVGRAVSATVVSRPFYSQIKDIPHRRSLASHAAPQSSSTMTFSRRKPTSIVSRRRGKLAPPPLNVSTSIALGPSRTFSRTTAPRKATSSTMTRIAFTALAAGRFGAPQAATPASAWRPPYTSFSAYAKIAVSPMRIASAAGSATRASSRLSVPMNEATKRLRRRL